MVRVGGVILTVLLWGALAVAGEDGAIARGDAAWEGRAQGYDGRRAAAGPIHQAIAAYEEALAQDPQNLEARWKLLRALYFKGEYVVADPEARRSLFARGRELAEEGLDLLARPAGGREILDRMAPEERAKALAVVPEAPALYFWAAVHWGLWGENVGKFTAARQGVGSKIRDYAETVIALDETYEEAGGHRILGRLHTEAPKIPFITGWVDREVAVSELRRAVELAPRNALNRLYLAEALIRFRPRAKAEARRILRDLAKGDPDPCWLVEESQVRVQARELLQDVEG